MIEAMYTTINMRKPRTQRRWTSAVDAVNTYSNGFLYISIVESITDILIEFFLICGKVIHIDRHKIWSMGNWSKNLKLLPPHFACFLVDMLLNILNIKNRKRKMKNFQPKSCFCFYMFMSSDLLNFKKMVSLPYFCETEQLVLQNEPVKFHFIMKSVDMQ